MTSAEQALRELKRDLETAKENAWDFVEVITNNVGVVASRAKQEGWHVRAVWVDNNQAHVLLEQVST